MANITINDLAANTDLDRKALQEVVGGISGFGWIQPYRKKSGLSAAQMPSVYYYDLSGSTFLENPTFVINQDFSTNNQYQLIDVDVNETINSTVGINLGQGQVGLNGIL
jgi:hypothetical protein